MSFPKLLAIGAAILFLVIGISAWMKGGNGTSSDGTNIAAPLEVELDQDVRSLVAVPAAITIIPQETPPSLLVRSDEPVPEANRIDEFFNKGDRKFPIVQTLVYKSRVPWQKGRPAWISDYAIHYKTSRHFIARSLNGKTDYFRQNVSEGDRFNVLNADKNINFYMVVDVSRSKLWLYYLDLDSNERVLVKTYPVGLGKIDSTKPSGLLTPLGKYTIGDKIAAYKPKMMGLYNGKKAEMITIYGTRWMPFIDGDGLGLHGVAWLPNEKGDFEENLSCLGKYESDGSICLSSQDIEEIYAIVISRLATVEVVKDFYEASILSSVEPAVP